MALLIFLDGRREDVEYNKAVNIKLVKGGATVIDGKPITQRQIAFAASVEEVRFEKLNTPTPLNQPRVHGPDPELRKIVQNPNLKGKAKFDAARKHMTSRKKEV